MSLKFYSFLILSFSILLISCKSAGKLYSKGNYDEAVVIAAKKLQKDPDNRKLLDVLQNAYRFAVEDHESRIRNYAANNNDLKWEWTYNEYSSLQNLYESIRRSPEVFHIVRPQDYSSYLITYGEKAGEARYERGLTLMANNDKRSFREAYREFQAASVFIPGDLGIRQKMEEAYSAALVHVIVLPLEERGSYQYSSFTNRYRGFDNNILKFLQQHNGNKFVRYYSPLEARGLSIRPDNIVDLRFRNINIGRTNDESSSRTVSKDVVIKETVYRPDSIVKEYARVNAKIHTTRRTVRSEGMVQVEIRDVEGRKLWLQNYSGQHFWATEYTTYTGDNRALSESDKQEINRNREQPPREDEVIRIIMDEIEHKLECGIRDYFRD